MKSCHHKYHFQTLTQALEEQCNTRTHFFVCLFVAHIWRVQNKTINAINILIDPGGEGVFPRSLPF